MLAKSVTVIMRGGLDYIDLKDMAKIYNTKMEVIYNLEQSKLLEL